MNNDKKIKSALNVAAIAGGFTLLVALLFLINFINIKQNNPVENEALDALVEMLSEDAKNATLIHDIRNLDLLARKAYFTGQWQINVASWLMLIGGIVSLYALRLYFGFIGKIDEPKESNLNPGTARIRNRKWIAGIGSIIVVLAFLSSFGSKNYLAKYELAKQTNPIETPVEQDEILVIDVGTKKNAVVVDTTKLEPVLTAKVEKIVVEEKAKPVLKSQEEKIDSVAKKTVEEKPIKFKEELKALKPMPIILSTINEFKEQHASFRGVFGQGFSNAKNIPNTWNGTSGENIKWKIEIPLQGYNSPVIWGDKLFLSGADVAKRVIYCINAKTGKLLWEHVADNIPGSPAKPPKVTDDTGLAAPTVAADGQRVYAIFGTGDVVALNMAGERIWAKNIGVPDNHYGHSSSLLCLSDKLFIQYDTNDGGRVLALNVLDGSVFWDTKRTDHISWASPVLAEFDGKMQLILSAEPNVAGYDIESGEELWAVECMMGEVGPSVAVGGGYVYAANEYATFAAINPTTKEVVWEGNEYLPEVSSPVYADGLVFIATTYGVFACYEAKTGDKVWEQEFDNGFYSSPMIADGKIYIVDMEGIVHVMKVAREAEVISENAMGEPIMSTPAFSDGAIYLRSKNMLYCIGRGQR